MDDALLQSLPLPIAHWFKQVGQDHPQIETAKLLQTLTCAFDIAQKKPSLTLDKALEQGIAISIQLLSLQCDTQTCCAALLYPLFSKDEICYEHIHNRFDEKIYKLLIGVQRMEAIDHLPLQEKQVVFHPHQFDKLRRMLLAIVDDVRIILLKLAERIVAMIQLRHQDTTQQQATAKQIMALYAPLANRLGIGQLKWQLEDWAFRFSDPDNYTKISKALKQRRQEREQYITQVQQELTALLNLSAIEKYELSGRAKHIYSIYRKTKHKELPFDQIYDSNAFRILVPNIEHCYRVLSLIHEKWQHIPVEFDDYIAKPKPNGYKSIHTIITGPNNRYVEIQIRTFTMHEEAELGVAAHWKYKEGKNSIDNYEGKINLLRNVISWQQELSHQDTQHPYQHELFEDRVYVFTPNNDILDLPLGATPLDVAYHIHTDLGHRCRGAKVNQRMVPLTYKVKTGDVIEVLTSKEGKPSRDWLNPERSYLASKAASAKVRNWFMRELRQERLAKGQEIWEKVCKRENTAKAVLNDLFHHYGFKNAEELLIAIGSGKIGALTVLHQLKQNIIVEKPDPIANNPISHNQTTHQISISGTDNLLTQLARCCQPIPGDLIVGYITKGYGVSIHRRNCHNLQQAMKMRPERILEVNWSDQMANAYPVSLHIEAVDCTTIIRDISAIIANENIAVLSLISRADPLKGRIYVKLTIEINDFTSLIKILQQLKQLPEVIKAERE